MSKGQWYTPFSHNWTLVMASLSPVLLRVETQQCLVWPQPWLSTPPPLIWKPQFCTTTSPLQAYRRAVRQKLLDFLQILEDQEHPALAPPLPKRSTLLCPPSCPILAQSPLRVSFQRLKCEVGTIFFSFRLLPSAYLGYSITSLNTFAGSWDSRANQTEFSLSFFTHTLLGASLSTQRALSLLMTGTSFTASPPSFFTLPPRISSFRPSNCWKLDFLLC